MTAARMEEGDGGNTGSPSVMGRFPSSTIFVQRGNQLETLIQIAAL